MKLPFILPLLFVCFACTEDESTFHSKQNKQEEQEQEIHLVIPDLQTILDSSKVDGSILIFDLNKYAYYSNDFDWASEGHLPASTFKIPNSIIALETSVVENDSTVFAWNGEKRRLKTWEQDLLFKEAFHVSCVPCYQEIARKIGATRMNEFLKKFDYGNMVVDSTNIDLFWLEGESKINQFQQIDFLRRFYLSELPISDRTEAIAKRMMTIEETDNYTLVGKTGWSIRNGNNNGWFVGYIVKKDRAYFFATNIAPEENFNMDLFPFIRNEITMKALRELSIID